MAMETVQTSVAGAMELVPSFKGMLWAGFGVFLVVYAILTLVLMYHWKRYSLQNRRVIFMKTMFLSVSAIMITAAIVALLAM